jgi:hypothetical protein
VVWRVMADALAEQHAAAAMQALALSARGPQLPPPPPSPALLPPPGDPRTRASPGTALGPVATPGDYRLTSRAAALLQPAGPPAAPASWQPAATAGLAAPGMSLTSVRAAPPPGSLSPSRSAPSGVGTGRDAAAGSPPPPAPRLPASTSSPAALAGGAATALTFPCPTASPPPRTSLDARGAPASPATLPPPRGPRSPGPAPRCAWLVGYSPTGCANVTWRPDTGLFAYTVNELVVIEHLASRRQRYLRGHNSPLACLAASADGAMLAAAPQVDRGRALGDTARLLTARKAGSRDALRRCGRPAPHVLAQHVLPPRVRCCAAARWPA